MTGAQKMIGQKRLTREGGFTLVELLVIVAILAVLFGLVALALRRLRSRTESVAQQSEHDVVDKALQICQVQPDCAAQITPVAWPQRVGPSTPGFGQYLRRSSRYAYAWDEDGSLTTFLAVDAGSFGFSGQEPPTGWSLGGDALLTAGTIDPADDGWLRLTPNSDWQNGYAYYDETFDSTNGLTVVFDFVIWSGNGADGNGADGLVFFLFDGSTENFYPGAYGGALGYAPRSRWPDVPGLSNGYLGVGFDEFGNFSNPTEGRTGGPGHTADSIAIRGPHDQGAGYEYLAGTGTLAEGIDISDGERPSSDEHRHAEIRIDRTPSGYTVAVWVRFGADDTLHEVISPTPIPDPPATLKLGFAGSTGALTNNHEVRNIGVRQ